MIPDVLYGNIINLKTAWFYSNLEVLVDPLSVLMACIITSVGFLVTLFSIGYMREEPSLTRFWFLIQLFIGGYLIIVMAGNLLFMFIGWEIVGVCCTGLAAFWHQDPEKANTGLKTFLILHVSDVLFLVSILAIFAYSNTFSITELSSNNNWMGELARSGLLFITALLFFGGAAGKSAQFPFEEWLPDALAASPSSFNALTECLAGPFIMARILPVFREASMMGYSGMINFFIVMTLMGIITVLVSALIAMAQTNIFRVLSYSISSVIGYMMVAFGLAGLMGSPSWERGYLAGTFLLTIDAFVSALLFLTAAYASYAVGSDILHHMSGFKSKIAHRSMEVGALAMGSIPPLSGFWCTNWIQNVALEVASEAGQKGDFALVVFSYVIFSFLIISGGVTAFFALRMMGLFFGKKGQQLEERPIRKPPSLMHHSLFITLIVTAFLDFSALFLIWPFGMFLLPGQLVFTGVINVLLYIIPSFSTVLTCVAVALGAYPAYRIYMSGKLNSWELMEKHKFLKRLNSLLRNRFYIDKLYSKTAYLTRYFSHKIFDVLEDSLNQLNNLVAIRFLSFAKLTHKYVETEGISNPEIRGFSRFYEMLSSCAVSLSQWGYPRLEIGVFEALNNKIAKIVSSLSSKTRKIQTGLLSYNILSIIVGTVVMLILIMKFGGFL
jgi:NADH-quinone oxidoreductase subunit L